MNPEPAHSFEILAFLGEVLPGKEVELADQFYYFITEDVVENELRAGHFDFLDLYDLRGYRPEFNDCDKFDHWCAGIARALHSRTSRQLGLRPGGVCFGCWRYKPAWSPVNHSINWFIERVPRTNANPHGMVLKHVEPTPQSYGVKRLSDNELKSVFKCAA